MEAPLLDVAGTFVAIVLTLAVFSFLLGDNVLFRLAEHIFVGAAVGYAAVVAFHSILIPRVLVPILEAAAAGDWLQLTVPLIPLVLGLLLLTKSFRWAAPFSWLGSLSVALLLGVGAALALAGALLGTLLPQISATADLFRYVEHYGYVLGLFSGIVVLIGVTGVLLHFYFGSVGTGPLARLRTGLVRTWGGLGRWFIFVAFGAILATTFMSRLSLFTGRMQFLIESLTGLIGG